MSDDNADADLLDAASRDLDGVEKALSRLDAGDYGTCEVCRAPIPPARLEADPLGARCPAHAGEAPASAPAPFAGGAAAQVEPARPAPADAEPPGSFSS